MFLGMHGFNSLSSSVLLSIWKHLFGGSSRSWGWGWISTPLGACSEVGLYVGRWGELTLAPRLDELCWLSESSVSCMENWSSSDFRYESVHSFIPKLKRGDVGCTVTLSNNEGEITTRTAGLGLLKLVAIKLFVCVSCYYGGYIISRYVVPSGYKIVISRALGMYGIYCTQPSGFDVINPSHPWYNYYIRMTTFAKLLESIFNHLVKGAE